VAIAVLLAGCGGSGDETTSASGTTAASTTTSTTTPGEVTLDTYFFRDAALVPVSAAVPATSTPAHDALEQLLSGAPDGYESSIPGDVTLVGVSIDGGVATARFSKGLGLPPRTAQAQIVSTLMQFPTVRGVAIEVEGEGAVPLQNGAGETVAPATDAAYVDLTADAPIFVRTPARDSTATSPVHASGTADVFEATFQVEIRADGRRVATKTITATSGSGTRGTWETTLDVPSGDVTLVFYEASARDGSPLHETQVHLRVS
jgi:immunoglobulin-like protein involved in spore germination/sporulation and spore germination protein